MMIHYLNAEKRIFFLFILNTVLVTVRKFPNVPATDNEGEGMKVNILSDFIDNWIRLNWDKNYLVETMFSQNLVF